MKKLFSLSKLLPLLFIFISCNNEDEKSNLNGYVFLSGTRLPVEGAIVSCGGQTATSSNDGSYNISNIQSGTNTLNCEKSDYQPYSSSISLMEGHNHIEIELQPNTTNLSGYILNSAGDPVQGVKVYLDNNPENYDYSDAIGHYQINSVPYGISGISLEKENYHLSNYEVNLYTADKEFSMIINSKRIEIKDLRYTKRAEVITTSTTFTKYIYSDFEIEISNDIGVKDIISLYGYKTSNPSGTRKLKNFERVGSSNKFSTEFFITYSHGSNPIENQPFVLAIADTLDYTTYCWLDLQSGNNLITIEEVDELFVNYQYMIDKFNEDVLQTDWVEYFSQDD